LFGETPDSPIPDVLRGFDRFAPQSDEWRQRKQRPLCGFTFDIQPGADMHVGEDRRDGGSVFSRNRLLGYACQLDMIWHFAPP
jgi:hypothetical protein